MNYGGEAVKGGKNAEVIEERKHKRREVLISVSPFTSSGGKYFVLYKED